MRTTGVTVEQVEQAAFKAYRNSSLTDENYGEYAEWAMGEASRFAAALVPPTARIIELDDLKTLFYFGSSDVQLIDRIKALIGEAT